MRRSFSTRVRKSPMVLTIRGKLWPLESRWMSCRPSRNHPHLMLTTSWVVVSRYRGWILSKSNSRHLREATWNWPIFIRQWWGIKRINQASRHPRQFLMLHLAEEASCWARIKSSSWRHRVPHRVRFNSNLPPLCHLNNSLIPLQVTGINWPLQLKKSRTRTNSADSRAPPGEGLHIFLMMRNRNSTLMATPLRT